MKAEPALRILPLGSRFVSNTEISFVGRICLCPVYETYNRKTHGLLQLIFLSGKRVHGVLEYSDPKIK